MLDLRRPRRLRAFSAQLLARAKRVERAGASGAAAGYILGDASGFKQLDRTSWEAGIVPTWLEKLRFAQGLGLQCSRKGNWFPSEGRGSEL